MYSDLFMSSIFDKLCNKQLISDYPPHLKNNIHYEVVMGSIAYGVSNDMSDVDVYGFAIPPKHIIFPYSYGNIYGFGDKPESFDQFQKHHIIDKDSYKEYDISIYNIVKYFQLCMENNPNMLDSLFVPTQCILHSTSVGNYVRDNRKLFLSKAVYHKYRGYAHSQLHKMKDKYALEFINFSNKYGFDVNDSLKNICAVVKNNDDVIRISAIIHKLETNGKRSKRLNLIKEFGYDVKFAYHVTRLLDECKMVLEEHDLDLTRSKEYLKSIRRGELSVEQIVEYFDTSMKYLDTLYTTSALRYTPDENVIKQLLIACIEMHYGNINNAFDNKKDVDKNLIAAYNLLSKVVNRL